MTDTTAAAAVAADFANAGFDEDELCDLADEMEGEAREHEHGCERTCTPNMHACMFTKHLHIQVLVSTHS